MKIIVHYPVRQKMGFGIYSLPVALCENTGLKPENSSIQKDKVTCKRCLKKMKRGLK